MVLKPLPYPVYSDPDHSPKAWIFFLHDIEPFHVAVLRQLAPHNEHCRNTGTR